MTLFIADRVKDSTTTTGLGSITVSGTAPAGFRTFGSATDSLTTRSIAVDDTLHYVIEAVDSSGIPTGDWEIGLGTWATGNVIERTTVLSSSTGSRLNLAAGTKNVYLAAPGKQVTDLRGQTLNLYVNASTGLDSRDGLNPSRSLLTIQAAVDKLKDFRFGHSCSVVINLAAGTYNAFSLSGLTNAPESIDIVGAGTATTTIATDGDNGGVYVSGAVFVTLQDVTMFDEYGFAIVFLENLASLHAHSTTFQSTGGATALLLRNSKAEINSCTVTGSFDSLIDASRHSLFDIGEIALTGTTSFSSAFIKATECSVIEASYASYTGTATGARYSVTKNAVLNSGQTLPGSVAGSVSSGGQYL